MFTQAPVASDGFILSLLDVLLLFSIPFASKIKEFSNNF